MKRVGKEKFLIFGRKEYRRKVEKRTLAKSYSNKQMHIAPVTV